MNETERKMKSKHDQLIMILRRQRFGAALSYGKTHSEPPRLRAVGHGGVCSRTLTQFLPTTQN